MEMTMEKLVEKLNNAAKEYYSGRESGMSDKEYDRLYDELLLMESETGKVLPNSPTRNVGCVRACKEKARTACPVSG